MGGQALLAILNHVLAQNRWARQRLQAHCGQRLDLVLGRLPLQLGIDAEGYFALQNASGVDVSITLPVTKLPLTDFSMERLLKEARIEGRAELANTLGFVFSNLRWDVEEDLSRVFGDILAHRLHQQAKRFFGWQREARMRFIDNFVEYATEERPLLPARSAFQRHASTLAQLDEQLQALEQRLTVLQARR